MITWVLIAAVILLMLLSEICISVLSILYLFQFVLNRKKHDKNCVWESLFFLCIAFITVPFMSNRLMDLFYDFIRC